MLEQGQNWFWDHLTPLGYGCIHADPPWKYETYSEKGQGRSPKYRKMSVAEICDLPVKDLARSKCLVAMWTVDQLLPQSMEVLDAWGFQYKTVAFCWVKTYDLFETQRHRLKLLIQAIRGRDYDALQDAICPIGQGHWTRANAELCLLARADSPPRINADVRRLILAPVRENSRKPDQVFDRLQRLVPGPYCDLFSRQERAGWDVWGDQTDFFEGEAS